MMGWFAGFVAAAILTHLAVSRLFRPQGFVRYCLIHGGVFTSAFIVLTTATWPTRLVLAYFFFSVWLLFVIFLINLRNSVSLQLLRNLRGNGEQAAIDVLRRSYAPEDLIGARVRMLETNGFISAAPDGTLFTTRKGKLLGAFVLWSRRILVQPASRKQGLGEP